MSKTVLVNDTNQRLGVTLLSGETIYVEPRSKSKSIDIDEGTLKGIRASSNLKIAGEEEDVAGQSSGDNEALARLVAENEALKGQLDRAAVTLADLKGKLDEAEKSVTALSADNADLKGKLDEAELLLLDSKSDGKKGK